MHKDGRISTSVAGSFCELVNATKRLFAFRASPPSFVTFLPIMILVSKDTDKKARLTPLRIVMMSFGVTQQYTVIMNCAFTFYVLWKNQESQNFINFTLNESFYASTLNLSIRRNDQFFHRIMLSMVQNSKKNLMACATH